jgi:hypothetical protein
MTTTGPAIQINDYLESWVTACNGNPGNTLKQLTIRKKPTDGTNTNNTLPNGTSNSNYIERKGWVIEANRSATEGLMIYFAGASRAADSQDYYEFVVSEKNNWFDSGQTNGYGLFSNWVFAIWDNFTADFNYANRSSFGNQFIISYSSDPNQEFFCVSNIGVASNSSYWFSWMIFKDNFDHWGALLVGSDASVKGSIFIGNKLRSIDGLIRNTTTTDARLTSVTLTTTSNLDVENGQNMPNPNRRIAHPQVLTVDNNQNRFTFGEELIVNSRQFYGLAPRLLVIEK